MKNLKRALALLVVVTMMISSVAFASFSDVTGSTNVANAVNVGVGLNLFKGYEDGTFKPEGDITRAEFAAIVVRAIGQEAQASGSATATSFTDVKADHWAAGYINIVTRLGIVNGYGDGTFGPEDKVTYEQAIKMIVVALGYYPAIGSAGYPVGYLTKAGELGITSGVAGSNGVPANRGTVAQLIFNALDVPIMQQTGYGTNLDFVVQDGFNNTTRKTLMSEYLDVVKLQVTVDSYDAVTSTTKDANDVDVTILNNYKTKYSNEFVLGSYTLDAGTSTVGSLVGAKAFVYVSYDDTSSDTPVVVYAVKDTAKTDEITVAGADIETAYDNAVAAVYNNAVPPVLVTPAVAATVATVEYWANETDKKVTKVTLPADAKLYLNGNLVKNAVLKTELAKDAVYGSVSFAKNDSTTTEDYDTVFVTNYTNFVVDSVNARTFKVSSKNAGSIVFDPDDTAVKSTLYDSKGVEMKWTDLKEWDVVSAKVSVDSTTNKKVTVGTLVTDKVTGKITEVDTGEYTIDGKVYETDSNYADTLLLEDEGTFYLDILGNICYADTTAALNGNFAYIFAASLSTGIDNRTEVKMFTKAGEFVTLKTASKVKLDGVSNIPTADLTNATKTTTVVTTALNTSTTTVTYGNTAVGVVGSVPDPVVYPYTIATTVPNPNLVGKSVVAANQFITYDVNSSNEITKIDRSTDSIGNIDEDFFAKYSTGPIVNNVVTSSEYSATSKTLTTNNSKVYVTDKTIIMVAYGTDEDNYELVKVAAIADEQAFPSATFYNVNANREVGAVLVNAPVEINSATNGIAAITGTSSGTNADGDTIVKLRALQNGAAATLNGSTDLVSTPDVGTALIPVLNTKGEVKSVKTLAVADDTANTVTPTPANVGTNGVEANKVTYTYGKVLERRSNIITIQNGASDLDVSVTGANVYIYDERSSSTSNRVTIGDITDFDAKIATQTDVNNEYADAVGDTFYDTDVVNVYAIAREYDGKIVDVMIYIFE